MLKTVIAAFVAATMMVGCCLGAKPPQVAESAQDPLQEVNRSVVSLRAKIIGEGNAAIVATGFAIDKERIMTAGHFCVGVVMGDIIGQVDPNIKMIYLNDNDELAEMDGLAIEALDEGMDLCVIKKKKHGLVPLKIIDNYSTIKTRDKVHVFGSPLGIFPVETEGRVIRAKSEGLPPVLNNRLFISAPATGGNSGGPVVNEKGEVIGVLVMSISTYEHITVATHADMMKRFLKLEVYGK